jgi:hypothetical protein
MRTCIGQTINFGRDGNATEFQVYGWSTPEVSHTWSVGSESVLSLNVPDAPKGYFLEIQWFPLLRPPLLAAQPLTIRVNGHRAFSGDVQLDEVAAFLCPAPRSDDGRLLVTFEHPNAARPADFGGNDVRQLALAFRRVRVLHLLEPWTVSDRRKSHHRLEATDLEGLATEAEFLTGVPTANCLTRFEMLAGNCDMGTAQRAFGVEPLSLLRFAGSYPAVSIKGLDTAFSGIGEDLEPWASEGEWIMRDRYGLNYHTRQAVKDVDADRVVAMERRRIPFLLRKFLADLADADKIYVADRTGPTLAGVLPLFLALNRHGPRRLLWVINSQYDPGGGLVEEVLPGLLVGHLYQFGKPMNGHVSTRGWLEVLVNAWLMVGSCVSV